MTDVPAAGRSPLRRWLVVSSSSALAVGLVWWNVVIWKRMQNDALRSRLLDKCTAFMWEDELRQHREQLAQLDRRAARWYWPF